MSSTETAKRCGNCNKSPADDPTLTLQACSRCKDKYYCNNACQSAAWPFHKANCKRPNYTLKVHLYPPHISNPDVIRILSVPAATSFAALHNALQIAFGWANTHGYDFAVQDPTFDHEGNAKQDIIDYIDKMMKFDRNGAWEESDPRESLLRISSQEPYRPGYKSDRIREGTRKHPRCVEKNSAKTKLFQVLDDKEYADKTIEYMYDFADNWKHIITIEGRTKAGDQIVCIGGSGHGVAEDAGGPAGWKELKEAYRTSTPTQEEKEKRQWFEHQASNADPRGLGEGRENEWSMDAVNQRLAAARL